MSGVVPPELEIGDVPVTSVTVPAGGEPADAPVTRPLLSTVTVAKL
mgnify:CR=1 FL=1